MSAMMRHIDDFEIVRCPLCFSNAKGVTGLKARGYFEMGHSVEDVKALKKACTRFAIHVEPSDEWSSPYFFRIMREVLRHVEALTAKGMTT